MSTSLSDWPSTAEASALLAKRAAEREREREIRERLERGFERRAA